MEKEAQVKVQEAEINRREKELIATVLKGAEIERQRIETLAKPSVPETMVEAEGRASAIRAQGEAEAEIIFKKGDAEARAMNVKAEAFQEYNQAAVVDKLITGLPEIVKALASPLSNVDKITIVSTGNGSSAGCTRSPATLRRWPRRCRRCSRHCRACRCRTCWARSGTIGDKGPKPDGLPPADDDGKSKAAGAGK